MRIQSPKGYTLYEIQTDAYFDSAHFLTDYFGKCENLHGHRWKITATIASEDLQDGGDELGMVQDFGAFKQQVKDLAEEFDHTFLVEKGSLAQTTLDALSTEGFSIKILDFRTTSENLAKHFFDILKGKGLPVISIEVDETPNNRAIYKEDL